MNRLIMVLATAALLAGCGESNAPEQRTSAPVTPYADLPNEAVLVTVNGTPLTKLDVETDLTLQLALMRMTIPNLKGDRISREQARIIRKSVDGFITRRVLQEEAARRGITATPAEIEAVKSNFVATALRGKKMTYAEMRGKLRPAMQKKIDEDLARDAMLFKLDRILAEEAAYTPTDAEVAEKLEKFAAYNKRSRELEAETWKLATNTWGRLRGGEPFERAAERLMRKKDSHVTYEPEWGAFELAFFNDTPEMQSCLAMMKPGMVSPPIAADNGIVIVKLLDIVQPAQPNGSVRYSLSEIHFALPEYYNEYTPETLKAELAKEMTKRQAKARVDALTQAAKITYPSGDTKQIFKKTQKEY